MQNLDQLTLTKVALRSAEVMTAHRSQTCGSIIVVSVQLLVHNLVELVTPFESQVGALTTLHMYTLYNERVLSG